MSLLKSASGQSGEILPFVYSEAMIPRPEQAASESPAEISDIPLPDQSELALRNQVAELERALIKERELTSAAQTQAFDQGHQTGVKEARVRDEDRLELLRENIAECRREVATALEAQEIAAINIACAILAEILGESDNHAELVSRIAAHWKAKLAGKTIVCLRVSAEDFGDRAALASLQGAVGSVAIETDIALDPGSCVFDLKLGSLDASIDVQHRSADSILAAHSATEEDGLG